MTGPKAVIVSKVALKVVLEKFDNTCKTIFITFPGILHDFVLQWGGTAPKMLLTVNQHLLIFNRYSIPVSDTEPLSSLSALREDAPAKMIKL